MAAIGIDLDGVGYDFGAVLKHWLVVWRGFRPSVLTAPNRWQFYRDWGVTDAEFQRHCHAATDAEVMFVFGDPINDFVNQLQRLRDAGHTLHIITDRTWGTNNRAQTNTYAWLAKHKVPYDTVDFTADKAGAAFLRDIRYMIDDKIENYEALDGIVDVWLLDQPWNQSPAGFDRVKTISEFVDYVLAAAPATVDVDAPIPLYPTAKTYQFTTAHTPTPPRETLHWTSDGAEPVNVVPSPGEVRKVSATGGEKGVKPARFDLLPPYPLFVIAEHFAKGAEKYEAHNWRRGYEWSNSFAALQRHLWAWWDGEDIDTETGSSHLAAAGFHVLALLQFVHDFPEFDDRYKPAPTPDDAPSAEAAGVVVEFLTAQGRRADVAAHSLTAQMQAAFR